jgi:hypothetical protein
MRRCWCHGHDGGTTKFPHPLRMRPQAKTTRGISAATGCYFLPLPCAQPMARKAPGSRLRVLYFSVCISCSRSWTLCQMSFSKAAMREGLVGRPGLQMVDGVFVIENRSFTQCSVQSLSELFDLRLLDLRLLDLRLLDLRLLDLRLLDLRPSTFDLRPSTFDFFPAFPRSRNRLSLSTICLR